MIDQDRVQKYLKVVLRCAEQFSDITLRFFSCCILFIAYRLLKKLYSIARPVFTVISKAEINLYN